MATTPNYGWVTPAPTDFVTDLPADFETFADAVDADLAGLLGGTTGQVLVKDSNADHDFSWTTFSSGASDWSLLNTGGTALTGSTTITVSGLSAKELLVLVIGASSENASSTINLRFNSDSAENYSEGGISITGSSAYSPNSTSSIGGYSNRTQFRLGVMTNSASGDLNGSVYVDLADKTGWKRVIGTSGGAALNPQSGQQGFAYQGFYEGSAAITSVSVISTSGNFDAGTVYVLGAN